MRRLLILLLACIGSPGLWAQEITFALVEGRRAAQLTAEAPVAPSPGGYRFQARLSVPEVFGPVTDAALVRPDGTSRTFTHPSTGEYVVDSLADSEAALGSAWPRGRYSLGITVGILGRLNAHADLVDGGFPPFPVFLRFAESASLDAEALSILSWNLEVPPEDGERLELRIVEAHSGEPVVVETDLDPSITEWSISAGTLVAGREYLVSLARVRRLAAGQAEGDEWFAGNAFRLSETVMSVRATGPRPPEDRTPPGLESVLPGIGASLTNLLSGPVFHFTEAIRPDAVMGAVTWSALLNGQPLVLDTSQVQGVWSEDRRFLVVTWSAAAGGWPAGAEIRWTLNPVAGAPGNLRDAAGNELPATSGSFLTAGGPDPCGRPLGLGRSDTAFALLKWTHHRQSVAAAPVADPERTPEAFAFIQLPPTTPIQTITTLRVPTSNPFAFRLLAMSPVPGGGPVSFRVVQESFTSRTALDEAYPEGTYRFELRDSAAQATHTAEFQVAVTGYPPVPRVASLADAQAIRPAADFTLEWDRFDGARPDRDAVSLDILDAGGNSVFHAPDPCRGIRLDATAGSLRIPSGILAARSSYTAELTFSRVSEAALTLARIPGYGGTALSRTTRFPIVTVGESGGGAPPRFVRAGRTGSGELELVIEGTPGRVLVLEESPGPGLPFASRVSTNASSASITFRLPIGEGTALFRVFHP